MVFEIADLFVESNHAVTARVRVPTQLQPRVLVEFRPHSNYDSEYGIDWVRMGDTDFPCDKDYSQIIGNYSWSSRSEGHFRSVSSEYERYLRQFESVAHPFEDGETWYVPIVTLGVDQEALFDLKLGILDEPDSLRFDYNPSLFELNRDEIGILLQGEHKLADYLNVKCIAQFHIPKFISVYAGPHLVGKIKFLANDANKTISYLPVVVNLRIPGTTDCILGGIREGSIQYLRKQMKHAFCDLEWPAAFVLDLCGLEDIDLMPYFTEIEGVMRVNISSGFLTFLSEQISHQSDVAVEDVLKFFILDIPAGYYKDINGTREWKNATGYAQAVGSDKTALFRDHYLFDASHEIMHASGLHHSFDNSGEYTFKKFETDNVMDYSEIATPPVAPLFTWAWQWKKMNDAIEI